MKLKLDRKKTLQTAKNTALVIIGTLILAFGASVFQVQFNLVMGGMTGLAIVFRKLIPGVEFLTVDFYVWVMTALFFIMGIITLGKDFTIKTLISTVVYPPAFTLCGMLVNSDFAGGLLNMGSATTNSDAALVVAAVFGGLLDGVGTGIAFLGGGSTGGVDVLAITVEKKVKRITSAKVLLIINTVVILLGVFVIGDIVASLLGIVAAFVSATAMDRIFCSGSGAFTAQIISDKYEEIRIAAIKMNRTSTIIPCVGGFSGKDKKMVQISFKMREYSELLSMIRNIDKTAFVTVHKAYEINGECWTWNPEDREASEPQNAVDDENKSNPCEENSQST